MARIPLCRNSEASEISSDLGLQPRWAFGQTLRSLVTRMIAICRKFDICLDRSRMLDTPECRWVIACQASRSHGESGGRQSLVLRSRMRRALLHASFTHRLLVCRPEYVRGESCGARKNLDSVFMDSHSFLLTGRTLMRESCCPGVNTTRRIEGKNSMARSNELRSENGGCYPPLTPTRVPR
jgi:hypothetical protein